MPQMRWGRLALLAVAGIVIGGGIVGVFAWMRNTPEALVKQAEAAYADGAQALDKEDANQAAQRLDEASLTAKKAIDRLNHELEQPKERTPEMVQQLRELQGRALLVQSRALRDLAYAQGKSEDKPLREATDTISNEQFRTLMMVPDDKVRRESLVTLMMAAERLTDNAEVQNELLRAQVMAQPIPWAQAEPTCERVLKLEPTNVRANFHLARYHFDQPLQDSRGGQTGPIAPEKRKLDRMLKAREHIEKVREAPNFPYWRTLDLETQITQWIRDEYARDARHAAKAAEEQRKLNSILFDEKTGVAAMARKDDKIAELPAIDVRGVLNLHQLGIKTLVNESGQGKTEAARVLAQLDATLELCERIATNPKASTSNVQEAASVAAEAMAVARPALISPTPKDWDNRLDRVQKLGKAAVERKAADPTLFANLARLADTERALAARIGETDRATRQAKLSDQWIDDGLKVCAEANLKPERLAELHALAAHRKALRGDAAAEYEPHLKALRDSKSPQAMALAYFLEGVAAERTGRLDKARKLFERAQETHPGDLRVNLALGVTYLSLNDPVRALPALEVVSRRYQEVEQLPEQDRKWAMEFLRDRDELDYLLVLAYLGSAQSRLNTFVRANPGKTAPGNLVSTEEEAYQRLIKKLPPRSPRGLAARRAYVAYLATTGRRDRARTELRMLQADHPNSLDLLQVELALMDRPASKPGQPLDPTWVEKVDARVQQFLADNPQETRAKLFWAAWLADSGRADKAIEYLDNPVNFTARDESHQRVMALALLRKGDRAGSLEILKHLPNSPNLDAAIIQLQADPAEREEQLKKALARHEKNGLLACLDGGLKLSKQQYGEAADAFFQALEFTRTRTQAEAGLQRALLQRAAQDPLGAQKQILALLQEAPDQPALYLAYALVSINTGEIGRPGENWDRTRNLTTALNRWEQLHLNRGGDPVSGILTRVECWVLANRFDLAQQEVRGALARDPKNERALTLGITLALDIQGPDALQEARRNLNTLKEIKPDAVSTTILEARVLEREGKDREAVTTLETALGKNKEDAQLHGNLQALLQRMGDTAAAKEHAQRWLSAQPNSLAAASAVVQTLSAAGQIDQAREAADKAVANQLKLAKEQIAKAQKPASTSNAEWEKKQKDYLDSVSKASEFAMTGGFVRGKAWAEATARLNATLAKDPKNEAALLALGDVYMGQEDWKKAEELYTKMYTEDPKQVIAANNLAWLLADKLNEPSRAFQIVEKLRLNPHTEKPLTGDRLRPEVLDTVGLVYARSNKPEIWASMKEMFSAAAGRYPSDPRMRLYHGYACAGLKDPDQARQSFNAAIALASPDAHHTLTAPERAKVRKEAEEALKRLAAGAGQ